MKRSSRVLVLTFAIAVMVASIHAGRSIAQLASNDTFAFSEGISGASGIVIGTNAGGAGKELGEPDHAGNSGGASVWWTWTAPTTGDVTFDTVGSNFDTLLAVYTGSSVAALTEVDSDDDTTGRQSEVGFAGQQGVVYHIAVDGYNGATGIIVLNWSQDAEPGPTCDPSMACGQAITCVGGLEYPTTCGPLNCDLPLGRCGMGGTGAGSGSDSFSLRSSISGASGREGGSNAGAGKESGEPNHAGNVGGASVWWTWTAPMTGDVTFNTHDSDFDTLLAVYTGSSLGRLKAVGSNDDTDGTLQSAVSFMARQGQTYPIAVDGYGGATGTIVLSWKAFQGSSSADAFASATAISGASGRSNESNLGASKEFGEPYHAGNRGSASVWWTWTAPATGDVTFDTQGSDFDTLLAIYTGAGVSQLTRVGSNDDTGGTLQSTVEFRAQQGRTYRIAVDGYGGAAGDIVLNWRMATTGGLVALPSTGVLDTRVTSYSASNNVAEFEVDVFAVGSDSQLLNLSPGDFRMYQDNRQASCQFQFQQTGVALVSQQYVGPYSATFLMDQSGSITSNDPQDARIQAALTFLDNLSSGDEVGLLAFADNGRLAHSPVTAYNDRNGNRFTTDADGFTTALRSLAQLEGGGTPLYQSVRTVKTRIAPFSSSRTAETRQAGSPLIRRLILRIPMT